MSDPVSSRRETAGYVELLRGNPDFRNFWYGQTISLFGDWFNLIASASLVAELSGSGLAIGGLFVVRMLAPFLVSPMAGVAADRYNRKNLLILTDIARAIVVLGFLFVRSPGQVPFLYVLTAVQLALSGVFFPTRNAILPDIVSRRELGTANALSSATWSIMLAVGAALGGLVAGGWGIYPAFVVDSATFIASAVFIGRVAYRPGLRAEERGASIRAALADYTEGLSYLIHHPGVSMVALVKAANALMVAGAYEVVQVALAKGVFPIGEGGGVSLGLFYAAAGAGTGIGPIVARRITGDREHLLRRAVLIGYILIAAGVAITSTLHSLGTVLLGSALRAVGGGINWVFSTQLLFHAVHERMRGRVFATEFAFLTLAFAMSAGLGGWIVDRTSVGIPGVLRGIALLALVPTGAWALWLARGGSRMETRPR